MASLKLTCAASFAGNQIELLTFGLCVWHTSVMASTHYRPGADRAYMSRVREYRAQQDAQPEAIAQRAAEHREKAEAHMQWVAMGRQEHRDLAMREYALAYEEEN